MAATLTPRDTANRGRTPQRWDPFRELEELHQRTLQLLGGAMEDGAPWVPLADVEETDDAWIVEAELPGVKKDDINVDVEGEEIKVSGEIKERVREGILRRRTRPVGHFELRVRVPGPVNADGIEANTSHGVLTVRIPKSEEAKPHRIEVQDAA
jgi:HSP20 family protein